MACPRPARVDVSLAGVYAPYKHPTHSLEDLDIDKHACILVLYAYE